MVHSREGGALRPSDEDIAASDAYTLKSDSSSTWTSFPSRISETVCTKNDATATYEVRLRGSLYGWKDNFIAFPKPWDSGPYLVGVTAIDEIRRRPKSAWVLRHHFWAEGPCIMLEPNGA